VPLRRRFLAFRYGLMDAIMIKDNISWLPAGIAHKR